MTCWFAWLFSLLLCLPWWAQGQVLPPDSAQARPDSLLFRPGNPPIVRPNSDSLLREINARPARDRFLDTTKLGTQPDSLKRAGDDTVQPSTEGGAPADTGKKRWPRPGLAARLSLVIPGAGQVYNKQIWKVPIVYGVLFTTGYFYNFWNREFLRRKQAYLYRVDPSAVPPPGYMDPYRNVPDQVLQNARDQARRYRDYNAFFFILGWTFNALEAYVGAHLRHFTVSDNLTMRISPTSMDAPVGMQGQILPVPALQLRFTIH